MTRVFCLIALLWPGLAWAQDSAPSGQPLVLWELRWERIEGGDTVQLVIRALAPTLGDLGYEKAQADMAWLCETHGRTIVSLPHAQADQVVVNIADRPVPRGKANPQAVQFFEVFALEDNRCISGDF